MKKSVRNPVLVGVALLGVVGILVGAIFLSPPARPSDVPSATNSSWAEIAQELRSECQEYEFFIGNTRAGSEENTAAWLSAVKTISGGGQSAGERSALFLEENPVIEDFASFEFSDGLLGLGAKSLNALIADGGVWGMERLEETYPETFTVFSYNTANKALEVCGLEDRASNLSDLVVNSKLIVERAANYTKQDSGDGSGTNPLGPETLAQENARKSAEQYLRFGSFSREGLISQLEFEGYERSDAVYGVDATSTDWKVQAALKAQEYLDYSSFSKEGLTDQLLFEGFTPLEVRYGLEAVGY